MTQPRGVINVVCAEQTRDFLRDVVNLVCDAARRYEECEPAGIRSAYFFSDTLIRFIPRNSTKPRVTFFADHGAGKTPEFPELRVVQRLERRNIFQPLNVQRRHGIQAEKIQARHTEMSSLDCPVVQARDSQRTAIAHALANDLPGVAEIVPIIPENPGHVPEVPGFRMADAKREGPF